jgi:hypothetical protein
MQLSEDLCLYIEYGYIIDGYISPCGIACQEVHINLSVCSLSAT